MESVASDFARTLPCRKGTKKDQLESSWSSFVPLEVRPSSDDSLGIASCDALGLMLFNPTEIPKSSAKVRNILKVFTKTTLQFHTCFNRFVTFAILGCEVFASLLLWFEAGFADMMNDNATACLMWQAMVAGCFVVWKAVDNHACNFALHPII